MKKILMLGLLAFISLRCTKEDFSTAAKDAEALNTESRDNCQCAVRVNSNGSTGLGFSTRNNYRITKNNSILWSRYLGALECGGSNMNLDQWYPVTIAQGGGYQLQYEFRANCDKLAAATASVSLSCGGNIRTFLLQTGTTTATNPAIVYFGRTGCQILEEQ